MNAPQPIEPLSTSSFDMLIALTAVLLLIFVIAWLLKRAQYGGGNNRAHLRILSILPMSGKERVVLIEVGKEQLLMGVSSAGIQHLHTLEQPVQVDPGETGGPPLSMSFADNLRRAMGRSES